MAEIPLDVGRNACLAIDYKPMLPQDSAPEGQTMHLESRWDVGPLPNCTSFVYCFDRFSFFVWESQLSASRKIDLCKLSKN